MAEAEVAAEEVVATEAEAVGEVAAADTIGPGTCPPIIPCGADWVPTPPEAEAGAVAAERAEEAIILATTILVAVLQLISNWSGDRKPKTTSSQLNMPPTTSGGTFGGGSNRRRTGRNSTKFRRMPNCDVRDHYR